MNFDVFQVKLTCLVNSVVCVCNSLLPISMHFGLLGGEFSEFHVLSQMWMFC